MAKEPKAMTTEEIYKAPIPDILALTIAANQICHGTDQNPYEVRNALILEEKKKQIRYKNGFTLPASAQAMHNDAMRKARHGRILARNILRAYGGNSKPAGADAHHIVAREDRRAELARKFLFAWGIAINDADNGVFLPRHIMNTLATHPQASVHQIIHTEIYYYNVTIRLRAVRNEPAEEGRNTLRAIRAELIAGTFPF